MLPRCKESTYMYYKPNTNDWGTMVVPFIFYAMHVTDKADAIETCHIMDSYLEKWWIVTQAKDQSELVDCK